MLLSENRKMKRALVTGGTKGIGLGITKMLLKDGYHVTLPYSSDETAVQKCAESLLVISPDFQIIKIDQSKSDDVNRLIGILKEHQAIDCIVFNAGMTLRKSLQETTNEDWNQVMNFNVNTPVFMLRDLFNIIPHNSRIVFIGSEMALYPHGTSLAYGVSKSAVHALAQNLVKVFEGTNTTVNAIAPGFVETEWQATKPQEIRQNIYNKTAIKRFATVEEIADAVRFCINNAFVNGSIIEVSGGYCYK